MVKRSFVDISWPAVGPTRLVFTSDGRSFFAAVVGESVELDELARAALGRAQRWGRCPFDSPPVGWRRV